MVSVLGGKVLPSWVARRGGALPPPDPEVVVEADWTALGEITGERVTGPGQRRVWRSLMASHHPPGDPAAGRRVAESGAGGDGRESDRWGRVDRQAEALAVACPESRAVTVSDREGDLWSRYVAGSRPGRGLLGRSGWAIISS